MIINLKTIKYDLAGGRMADEKSKNCLNGAGMDEADSHAAPSHSEQSYFEIRVKGQLDSRWSEWLEGLAMKHLENGEMILFGPIADQAALIGILNKLGRLNLTLRSVNEVKKSKQEI